MKLVTLTVGMLSIAILNLNALATDRCPSSVANKTWSQNSTNDSGGTALFSCDSGYTLKSNRSGGKWVNSLVGMGNVSDTDKTKVNDVYYTCQKDSSLSPDCTTSSSGKCQLVIDIAGKDQCYSNDYIIGFADHTDSDCPDGSGDHHAKRVTAGTDQCFYYHKPNAK